MGQGAGGRPEALTRQSRQSQQMCEGGRIVTLREEAHACRGEIRQLTRRFASEMLPIPHRARL